MARDQRPWWRNQTWGIGTLAGGVVLGVLIGASGGAATMALVSDDGAAAPGHGAQHRDARGQGHGQGHRQGHGHAYGHQKHADKSARKKAEQKADEKADRRHWSNGMTHGRGPDGQGPPGLAKKR